MDFSQSVVSFELSFQFAILHSLISAGRPRLKCDGTRAETRFRLSAKRTSPFESAGAVSSVDCWQPGCAHQLSLLVVMLDTPCSEVVRRVLVLATHSIRQFPLHFPSRTSPCAMTFQLNSTQFQHPFFGRQRGSVAWRYTKAGNMNGWTNFPAIWKRPLKFQLPKGWHKACYILKTLQILGATKQNKTWCLGFVHPPTPPRSWRR